MLYKMITSVEHSLQVHQGEQSVIPTGPMLEEFATFCYFQSFFLF